MKRILYLVAIWVLTLRPVNADAGWILHQNTPNPFGGTQEPTTSVTVTVGDTATVGVFVYTATMDDVLAAVGSGNAIPGDQLQFTWDGKGFDGSYLAPGTYAYIILAYANGKTEQRGETMYLTFSPPSPTLPTSWGAIKSLYGR